MDNNDRVEVGKRDGDGMSSTPPPEVIKLWAEVADVSLEEAVIYQKVVTSLENARKYLTTSKEARHFVDECMAMIVSNLLNMPEPMKIGQIQKDCVDKSLHYSLNIICDDLKAKVVNRDDNHNLQTAIDTLSWVFAKGSSYYKTFPEVRYNLVLFFQRNHGFGYLADYYCVKEWNQLDLFGIVNILGAIYDSIHPSEDTTVDEAESAEWHQDAKANAERIADGWTKQLFDLDEEDLGEIITEDDSTVLGIIRHELYQIYLRIYEHNPPMLYKFFLFWRNWILKLVKSKSHSLKEVVGWKQMTFLVEESKKMLPPPRSYVVSGAGSDFVNGRYDIMPDKLLPSGYVKPNAELWYQRTVPNDFDNEEVAGRVLTLFRVTISEGQEWWFLSKADEQQPGTERDIDYYQHKSEGNEERLPSSAGWLTCHDGLDPPPSLEPVGLLVPAEDTACDYEQLVKWILENEIVRLAFGDSMNSEIVEHSAPLIKFLAGTGYLVECFEREGLAPASEIVSPQMVSVLEVVYDSIPSEEKAKDLSQEYLLRSTNSAKGIADVCLHNLIGLDETYLNGMDMVASDLLAVIRAKLYQIYVRVSEHNPPALSNFFVFWRNWILKLITSTIRSVKIMGLKLINDLVIESKRMLPPPRSYVVSGAGIQFVNGTYNIMPDKLLPSGYVKPNAELWYQRTVPDDFDNEEVAGRVLTLFRVTMRRGQKWWFLSKADEQQPGTDRDIDYYQHKSSKDEERLPSSAGWLPCGASLYPSPSLEPVGLLVPAEDTASDYEQQLLKWTVENEIVQLAFGDSMNSEIVEHAAPLIKFLASKCNEVDQGKRMNKDDLLDCFRMTFLRTCEICSNTPDLMLLASIHKLLVSIEPLLYKTNLQALVSSIIKTAIIRRVEQNDPSFDRLVVESNSSAYRNYSHTNIFLPGSSNDLAKLGHSIARSAKLNSIYIRGALYDERDPMISEFIDGLKRNVSIQSLGFEECNISTQHHAILNAFAVRKGDIVEIVLMLCDLSIEGRLDNIVLSLKKFTALEKIRLMDCGINSDLLFGFVAAITGHSKLQTLDLDMNDIGDVGCGMLAELLTNPQCNLVKLNVCGNSIGSGGYCALANALTKNNKLEILNLQWNDGMTRLVWDAFAHSLCDTTSIYTIFTSNHTFKNIVSSELDVDRGDTCFDFYRSMNEGANKRHVALRKILCHHSHFDMKPLFEWDLKMLPGIFSWFEAAKSCEGMIFLKIPRMMLSCIFQYVHAMPMMCVPNGKQMKKRKIQKVS